MIPLQHIMNLPHPLPEVFLTVRHAADGGHRVKQIQKGSLMLLFSPRRQSAAGEKQAHKQSNRKNPAHITFPQ